MKNRTYRRTVRFFAIFMCMMIMAISFQVSPVWAASSSVEFGSTSYTAETGTEMKVGVYIRSDVTPGNYHVEVTYDASRLEYISGGDAEENGVITLEGTAADTQVKYMLYFNPISGGNAGIFISDAKVYQQDGQNLMTITNLAKAPITISGTDTTNGEDFSYETSEEQTDSSEGNAVAGEPELVNDIPVLGTVVDSNGQTLYIVDLSSYIPAEATWSYSLMEGEYGGRNVTFLTDTDKNVRLLYLMNEAGEFILYACADDDILYPCGSNDDVFYVSSLATLSWPEGLTEDYILGYSVVYAIDQNGTGGFYRTDTGKLIPWDEEEETETESSEAASEEVSPEAKSQEAGTAASSSGKNEMSLSVLIYICIALVGVILLLLILVPIIRYCIRKKKAKNYLKQLPQESEWTVRETSVEEKPYEKRGKKKTQDSETIVDDEELTALRKEDPADFSEDEMAVEISTIINEKFKNTNRRTTSDANEVPDIDFDDDSDFELDTNLIKETSKDDDFLNDLEIILDDLPDDGDNQELRKNKKDRRE